MNQSGTLIVVLLLPLLLLAAIALWTIIRGWRGRWVGDHPHCRRCGFDLFGSPESSDRCPECGADLARLGARVTGVRQRRLGRALAGLVLLVCAIGFAVLVGGRTVQSIEWGQLRPTWYAMREARGALPGSRSGAVEVLLSRAESGSLDAAQRATLVSMLVSMHADASAAWNPTWGGWLVEEMVAGRLPQGERDAFLRSLYPVSTLRARPVVRVAKDIPMEYSLGGGTRPVAARPRGMSSVNAAVAFHAGDVHIVIDGRELKPMAYGDSYGMQTINSGSIGGYYTLRPDVPLAPGTHKLELRTVARVMRAFDQAQEICQIPVDVSTTITVVPTSDQDVTRMKNDTVVAGLQSMLTQQITVNADGRSGQLELNFDPGLLPVPVGFDVSIKQGDVERHVGSFSVAAGSGVSRGGTSSWGYGFDARGLKPGTADLRLTPSEDAARGTLDVFQIWDGELVFHDVPVTQR